MPTYVIENFIIKAFDHFSVFSKSAELLNEILDITEIGKYILLIHMTTRWLALLVGIEKVVKLLASHKFFQSMGQE